MGFLKELIANDFEHLDNTIFEKSNINKLELEELLLERTININSMLRDIKKSLLNIRRDLIFLYCLSDIERVLKKKKNKGKYNLLRKTMSSINGFSEVIGIDVSFTSYKNINSRVYKKKILEVKGVIDDLNKTLLSRLNDNFNTIFKLIKSFSTELYDAFNEVYLKRSDMTGFSVYEKLSFWNKTKINGDKKIIDNYFLTRMQFFNHVGISDLFTKLSDTIINYGEFPPYDLMKHSIQIDIDLGTYYISPNIRKLVKRCSNDDKFRSRLLLKHISETFSINEKLIELVIHNVINDIVNRFEKESLNTMEKYLHFLSILHLSNLKPMGILTKEYLFLNYSLLLTS